MNQEKAIKQILRRLDRLEKAVFGKDTIIHAKKVSTTSKRASLPGLILKLRDQGFFKQPKTVKEVHKKILPMYHCNHDRVDTALRRLKKRKQLRISSKIIGEKKVLTYVW
ncbi:MAG: hypothetical protein E3J36_02100 [Candidatus Nealsonbacteria bacterium]|nr:MAG: hypothetical protein E3J36_02100 [Candidatus Nealsonbacteria bacterium]